MAEGSSSAAPVTRPSPRARITPRLRSLGRLSIWVSLTPVDALVDLSYIRNLGGPRKIVLGCGCRSARRAIWLDKAAAGSIHETHSSEGGRRVERMHIFGNRRPGAALSVGDTASAEQIQPPHVAHTGRRMRRISGEVAKWNGQFHRPITILGRFGLRLGTLERGAVHHTFGLPGRRPVPPIGFRSIQHGSDGIDLKGVVIRHLGGIRADENLDTIVLGNRPMPLDHTG